MNGIENINGVTGLELSKAVAGNTSKGSAAAVESKPVMAGDIGTAKQEFENSKADLERIKSDENFQKEMAVKIEKSINNSNIGVQFGVDSDSGKQYFKIVDKVDHKVLKQFPPEEILEMAKKLREFHGSIVNVIV